MAHCEDSELVGEALVHLSRLARYGDLEVHQRVDLRLWTAMRLGGTADVVVRCRSASAVREVLDVLATFGVRWVAMGGGSRLVPSDAGLRVPVLLPAGGLAGWSIDAGGIVAGAGANLARLAVATERAGLRMPAALDAASSTVGGAVAGLTEGRPAWHGRPFEWVDLQVPGREVERLRMAGDSPASAALGRRVVVAACIRSEGSQGPEGRRRQGIEDELGRSLVRDALVAVGEGSVAEALDVPPDWEVVAGGCRLAADGTLRLGVRRTSSEVREVIARARSRAGARWGTLVDTRLSFVDQLGRRMSP